MTVEKFVSTTYLVQCDQCDKTWPELVKDNELHRLGRAGWTIIRCQGEFTTILCPRHTVEHKELIR